MSGRTQIDAGIPAERREPGRLPRAFLTGALAGWLLSLARAPLGASLTSVPAVGAVEAAVYRGLALAVVGLALARARVLAGAPGTGAEAARPLGAAAAWLLFGLLAGFGLHGLWLVRLVEVGGPAGLALALLVTGAAMLATGSGSAAGPGRRGLAPSADRPGRPGALECLGLALGGGGVAIALEGVARPLRLLGTATPHDDTLFALTLVATVAVGAVAFGPLLAGRGRPVLAAGLALTALACLASAHLLSQLSTRNGLDGFLRSPPWSLDLAWLGRLAGGALIGARTFLVPGFVLGAALFGARHRLQPASALLGAALGLVVLNGLLVDGAPAELRALSFHCAGRVALGSLCAGLGGLLALVAARRSGAGGGIPATALGAAACLAAMLVPRLVDRPQVLPVSPWETFAPDVAWAADTPEGLLTVESSRGGEHVLTLDRRLLTPVAAEARADENRLEMSWLALPEGERKGARVLLVGQLTPLRAWVLRRLGAASVDRTAAWHASMPAIEELLFGSAPDSRDGGGFAGRVLAPGEARDRLADGGYDLVIVPPAGPRGMRAPSGSSDRAPAVTWLYADGDLVGRDLGERALPSSDGVDYLALGVPSGRQAGALGVPTGRPRLATWPLALLHTWPFDRSRELLLELGRRLDEAGRGTPDEDLLTGLRMHLAAQTRSTPWENLARATETDPEALAHLERALVAAEPGSPEALFLRRLWEGLAATLVEKRELISIETYLAPLAERFAPWVELERALAHADIEMLEPEAAAEHLRVVVAGEPLDLAAHMALGHALEMAGDAEGAIAEFRRALEIQPGRRDLRRRLAMALARAGDPEGSALVEELLREDPDDGELERYLGVGPFPPLEVRFVPFSDEHMGRKPRDPEADEHGHGEHGDHEH